MHGPAYTAQAHSRQTSRSIRSGCLLVTLLGLIVLSCPCTWADSCIAYTSHKDQAHGEIYLVNPLDGSQSRLTYNQQTEIHPAWSPDGSQLAFSSDRNGYWEIFTMSADGSQPLGTGRPGVHPAWSPDGSRIAFRSGNDLAVMRPDGSDLIRLTDAGSGDAYFSGPSWAPTGNRLALYSSQLEVFSMDLGDVSLVQLTDGSRDNWNPAWSPDGSLIAYVDLFDLAAMKPDGSGSARITKDGGNNNFPSWSPDGSRLCFTSKRAGSWEIFAINADGSGAIQLTHDGSNTSVPVPAWSPELDSIPAPVLPDSWGEVKAAK